MTPIRKHRKIIILLSAVLLLLGILLIGLLIYRKTGETAYPVEVTLVDRNGTPIPHISVHADGFFGLDELAMVFHTDSDGRFTTNLHRTTLTFIIADAEGKSYSERCRMTVSQLKSGKITVAFSDYDVQYGAFPDSE